MGTSVFLFGSDVDQRLGWPIGKADRLARQRRLPHYLLPDGSVRFEWSQIEPLIVRVPEAAGCAAQGAARA